ncbi:MAG TPA: hypothetical protein VFR15_20065 [Chloroflexia bacterium]|nr:hypothetical protein [Chloroflexia bacterium]
MEQDFIDLYLQQVSKYLGILPEKQRNRALDEIRLHIKTSRAIGRTTEAAIERLGPADELAAQYVARYGKAASRSSRMSNRIPRQAAAAAWGASFIVVPALALVALEFALAALVVPMLALLQLFTPQWIVMGFAGWELSPVWGVPVAAVVGLVLGGAAWAIYAGLKAYVRWASTAYEQHAPAGEPQAVRVSIREM